MAVAECDREMLTVPQAAQLLTIGKSLAWEMVWRGDIPHVRIGERVVRVARRDVEEYIATHRQQGASSTLAATGSVSPDEAA